MSNINPDKGSRKIGRPKKWTQEAIESLAKEMEAYFSTNEDAMFFEDFYAQRPGTSRQLIHELQSINSAFSDTIKRLTNMMEHRLVKAMLKQKVNTVAAIFVLKNKHGWADKQEVKTENRNVNVDLTEIRQQPEDSLKERIRELTE